MPIGHYARVGAVFPWLSFCIPFLVLVTISKSHNVQLLNRRFTDEDFEALSRPVPRHYPSGHQHIMAEVLSLTPSFLPKDWPIQDQAGHQDAPGPHSMLRGSLRCLYILSVRHCHPLRLAPSMHADIRISNPRGLGE